MSRKDLVAILPGHVTPPAPLKAVQAAGWTAVLARSASSLARGRRAILRQAAQRQAWIEALMHTATVLPVLPGMRIDPDIVPATLEGNAPLLTGLAERLAGQVQFQVTLRCDLSAGATRLGPALGTADKASIGPALRAFATSCLERIPGAHVLALPRDAETAVNLAVMLPAEAEAQIDDAVAQIDALWTEGFALRQIGPSPAVSFASLGVNLVRAGAIEAAARQLHLPLRCTPEALQTARRRALMAPGADPAALRNAADLLEMAQRLETPGPFAKLYVWSEDQSAPQTEAEAAA